MTTPEEELNKVQRKNITIRAIRGAERNAGFILAFRLRLSFLNSLAASAKGCGSPIKPGLLGPLRA